jgi:hypothetical protein
VSCECRASLWRVAEGGCTAAQFASGYSQARRACGQQSSNESMEAMSRTVHCYMRRVHRWLWLAN